MSDCLLCFWYMHILSGKIPATTNHVAMHIYIITILCYCSDC